MRDHRAFHPTIAFIEQCFSVSRASQEIRPSLCDVVKTPSISSTVEHSEDGLQDAQHWLIVLFFAVVVSPPAFAINRVTNVTRMILPAPVEEGWGRLEATRVPLQ